MSNDRKSQIQRKREAKAAQREELPITLNFMTFLEHDKKSFILEYARVYLSKVRRDQEETQSFTDSLEFKLFDVMLKDTSEGQFYSV